MIPKSGHRFSEKIMRQQDEAGTEMPDRRGIKVDSRGFFQG